MLFTPERHEPLAGDGFSEAAARDAIARIVERAERALDAEDGRWPLDPEDATREDEGPASDLYCGAAGVAWALGELAADGYADGSVGPAFFERLEQTIVTEPGVPEHLTGGVWGGPAGVLAAAERRRPDPARRDRLAKLNRAWLGSPALDPMFGHPSHMTLAAELHDRTGEERWAELWSAGAERLLAEWRRDDELDAWVWTQRFGEQEARYVGAAHGLVGNVQILLRSGLLPPDARADVERRAVQTLSRLAVVEDGRANWPAVAGDELAIRGRIRVQWCHGATGVLTSMWDAAPDDEAWGELLLAAGRLVWEAGPIRDAAGLCHGTAGNAYALLALWRRTGDEAWLERARAFAQQAAAQAEERAARVGHGWHSLFTGDEGVALCLASCLSGDERMPIVDRLIAGQRSP
jgi:Lanthionine synthetase C-like protein